MKKLPIGISTFKEIIQECDYYVDKTPHIRELVENGKYYFLSRPRRFGKSLFLSTLKSAFVGQQELFKGLYLENNWNWKQKYPVIHFSFGGGVIENRHFLDIQIEEILAVLSQKNQISLELTSISGRFSELIQKCAQKYNEKVVVLIDEYDKPLLDNITRTEIALKIREGLKNFYSAIKENDEYLKFVFLTGVSKFSKVSLFSGLNNLEDITLIPKYATICGYKESDIKQVFRDKLVDVDLEQLRLWYNGYNFLGESVYNPFDVLLYLKNKKFRNYWFETATPSFLIKLLQERNYYIPSIENIEATETMLGLFEVDNIEIEALMFQTGYLTIQSENKVGAKTKYQLKYPNLEVKISLTDYILNFLSKNALEKEKTQTLVYNALQENRLTELKNIFYSFFASIPHDWYRKNQLSNYEGYYVSIFYCYFAAIGLDVTAEDTTNKGRIDLTVKLENQIYLIEFKVVELDKEGSALRQLKSNKYYEKYHHLTNSKLKIFLIGVEFSREEKNIVNFEWEELR